MYCEKCGNLIQEGFQFCMNCGTKIVYEKVEEPKPVEFETSIEVNSIDETTEKVEEVVSTEMDATEEPVVYSGMHCSSCGFEYFEGEKYCISCGSNLFEDETTVVAEKVEEEEIPIQKALFDFFNSNKVLAFILKYSWFFVLVYPIFTLMGRFDIFNNIYESISTFTIILYFIYNIGLLAAYTDKNHLGLFLALALRFLNSSILVFQSTVPWESVFRLAVIIVSTVFIYKELMTDSQRKDLLGKFKFLDTIRNK